MHGGIGRSIYHVEKIENIITMDAGSIVLMDLLCVEGLRPNARGPGLVTFGQFHPLKGHIEDAWMLELNANRPATPTRGRPLQMTKEVLWLRCKVEEEALMHICLLVFHLMFVYRKDEVWRNQQGCKLR
ncbi:PREDICTED: serine/threonine-protein phosphatase BSL2-like [Brassica oleracea var. oleracea]|uniref:serine/threonine-protein phosphatase BSL2-like n=1 Tax=Brassica oleracea var. oleracea TaxID=109376 RepID=UPI0006A70281|nr:PREDICTED: serine/threonine-protein phosphatase BSL2-like [Brassica oleracea var. oleracea]XP_013638963.1 PREDICTED: serine/threonine-protein phosphatase BSL2-like [Brassica oleracea var. oleracea]